MTPNSFNPDNVSFWERKLAKNKELFNIYVLASPLFFFISVQSTPAKTAVNSQLGYLPLQTGSPCAGDPQTQSGELTECHASEF